jgi:uncharacterized SAM-binding protein YcdF (DUF218 family)
MREHRLISLFFAMFYIVSKLLAFVVNPIIWVFVLLLLTLLAKDPKKKRKRLIWAVVIFYVFSNSYILDEFMRSWEVPAISYDAIPEPYDAGIVLGGVISYDPAIDRFQFQRQGDRIIQALLLYRNGKIKKILFSGGAGALNDPENKEGPRVKAFLLAAGVPEQDILIEGESRNTRQNAMLTKALLDRVKLEGKFLLITSASHQRRAVRCFEKAGVPVTPFSVDRYSGPRKFEFDHLFIPNAHTLFSWEGLMHEYFGFIAYKMAGYI